MGVDCRINLPDNVSVRNVASVIGRLAGLPVERFQHDQRTWWAKVAGVKVETTSVPEMVMIRWENRHTTYHFEYEPGGRLLLPRCTAFWIAIGNRLVDFFGGRVDWNDSDATDWDYEVLDKGREANNPQDGEPWYDLQKRLMALKPLTHDEIKAMKPHAAYEDDGYLYAFGPDGHLVLEARADA